MLVRPVGIPRRNVTQNIGERTGSGAHRGPVQKRRERSTLVQYLAVRHCVVSAFRRDHIIHTRMWGGGSETTGKPCKTRNTE